MKTLAIDIGGTKFGLALFDGQRLVRKEIHPTDREGGREWMVARIEAITTQWRKTERWDRCAIGFGGPVDFARQRIALSTHVDGWHGFPLCERWQSLWNCPVVIDNDANCAALGEAVYGAGKAAKRPLFYVTLSTGIGGGIVDENNRLWRGANSWAGEIGHLNVEPEGPACLCGSNGCLERMCCGLWLERDHGKPAVELFRDPAFVAKYAVPLARGLKAAIMLLNPALIVLGGGIANAGDRLLLPLRAELDRQMPDWSQAGREIALTTLEGANVLWGALALAQKPG